MHKICNEYANHMQIYANINMHIYAIICKVDICNYMLVCAQYTFITLYVLICRYIQSDKYAKYAIKICINMHKKCNKYANHMQIYANINMHIYARICKMDICWYMHCKHYMY